MPQIRTLPWENTAKEAYGKGLFLMLYTWAFANGSRSQLRLADPPKVHHLHQLAHLGCTGLLSRQSRGFKVKPTHSTGMPGQSSVRGQWCRCRAYQTTTFWFSIGSSLRYEWRKSLRCRSSAGCSLG